MISIFAQSSPLDGIVTSINDVGGYAATIIPAGLVIWGAIWGVRRLKAMAVASSSDDSDYEEWSPVGDRSTQDDEQFYSFDSQGNPLTEYQWNKEYELAMKRDSYGYFRDDKDERESRRLDLKIAFSDVKPPKDYKEEKIPF